MRNKYWVRPNFRCKGYFQKLAVHRKALQMWDEKGACVWNTAEEAWKKSVAAADTVRCESGRMWGFIVESVWGRSEGPLVAE